MMVAFKGFQSRTRREKSPMNFDSFSSQVFPLHACQPVKKSVTIPNQQLQPRLSRSSISAPISNSIKVPKSPEPERLTASLYPDRIHFRIIAFCVLFRGFGPFFQLVPPAHAALDRSLNQQTSVSKSFCFVCSCLCSGPRTRTPCLEVRVEPLQL